MKKTLLSMVALFAAVATSHAQTPSRGDRRQTRILDEGCVIVVIDNPAIGKHPVVDATGCPDYYNKVIAPFIRRGHRAPGSVPAAAAP